MVASLLMLLPAVGFLESSLLYPRAHDLFFSDIMPSNYYSIGSLPSCSNRQPSRTPEWTSSNDAFSLKMLIPEMEPDSIGADLIQDESGGLAVKVTGTRKIEGCSCQPTAVREVPLPYRARSEDVSIHTDGSSVVTVKLARGRGQAGQKIVPLTIVKENKLTTKPALASTEVSVAQEAPKPSLESQERSLTDKFRAAAHAATAVARGAPAEEVVSTSGASVS
jgi:hypothetical protein